MVSLLLLGGHRTKFVPTDARAGTVPFADILHGRRVTEARLTGGFTDSGPVTPLPPALRAELLTAADAIIDENAESQQSLHARGVVHLLLENSGQAIDDLASASEQGAPDPDTLTDLSAAYLQRASQTSSARDLVDAFEVADRAFELRPTSVEAAFNRALAIERLGLRIDALGAWHRYTALDRHSPWSTEASRHLHALAQPTQAVRWEQQVERLDAAAARGDLNTVAALVRQYPQQARLHFEDELVARWASAHTSGVAVRADTTLRILRTTAEALRSVSHNALPQQSVSAIVESMNAPERLDALVRGHLAYERARGLYKQLLIPQAESLFVETESLFRRAGSPFALLALFHRASSRSYENDIDRALELLQQNEHELKAMGLGESQLQGQIEWVRGRALLKRGLPYESLQRFERASAILRRTGEAENVAAIYDLLGFNYEFLGDEERAWSHYIEAIRLVEKAGPGRRERVILHDVAGYALHHDRPRAALLFASALLRFAENAKDAGDKARGLLDRGRALAAMGAATLAEESVAKAHHFAATLPDSGLRDELQSDVAVAEADIALRYDPARAVASYDQAITILTRVERETLLPRLWIDRGHAALAAGRKDDAERSWRKAITLIERDRSQVADHDLQIAFAEQWYRSFDAMVELLIEQGRSDEALAYVERSRSRVLFEEIHESRLTAGGTDLPPPEIARRIPPGVTVLLYAVLEKSSAVWLVGNQSIAYKRLAISREQLEHLVGRVRSDIDAEVSEAVVKQPLAILYDELIRPIERELPPGDRLVFAPDASLQFLPFAALYDRERRRWLVEDRTVSVTPALHIFLASRERDRSLASSAADRVLIIGDPAFNRVQFPRLDTLPHAAEEARRIAALYDHAETFIGPQATRMRLLTAARGASIVHIAAHAVVNVKHPASSALILAPDQNAGDSGIVYAFDIDREVFGATRLLVLAACQTAAGRQTRYEGPLGLARRVLAAGVPSVLATMWSVDDASSRDLLVNFHRQLQAGNDLPSALREAQLIMIRHPGTYAKVAAWAGFQAIGNFSLERR